MNTRRNDNRREALRQLYNKAISDNLFYKVAALIVAVTIRYW
jgi:hypothetical protein